MVRFLSIVICFLAVFPLQGFGQRPAVGRWEGAITIQGFPLGISVSILSAADTLSATIDIPQQNARALPLRAVRYADRKLHFELPAGPGLAVFDGTLDGDTVRGDFRQGGVAGVFEMHRGPAARQPEEKKAVTVPYREEEVRFFNDKITLAGTLTLPKGPGPFAAVVFLTGSGPENRDEEIFGFKIFQLLADTLTRSGIAVLRFDDRGVGGSSGIYAETTTDDYAGDAVAAIDFLRTRSEINRQQIGLLGHSEGALAVELASSRVKDMAFAVLMAGPAIRGDSIISSQVRMLGKAAGISEEDLLRKLLLQKRVFEVVSANKGWDSLQTDLYRESLRAYEKAGIREQGGIPADSLARMGSRGQIQGLSTPWFRRFISLDPGPLIRVMRCPILALFAEKDMQVAVRINRPALEENIKAGGSAQLTVKVIPGANHLFQKAISGHPSEYGTLKKEFAPGVTEAIAGWIVMQVHH